jgi:hypothetical protein
MASTDKHLEGYDVSVKSIFLMAFRRQESNKYYIFLCVFGWVGGRVHAYLSSMRRAAAIFSESPLVPPYFSTLSHERHDFRKNLS